MATITMQTLSDYWARVYNWIGTGGIPSVAISGTPSVTISGTPNVAISGTPNVSVSNASLNVVGTGNVAHGSPVSGNPIRIAGRGQTANVTAVDSGDVVDLLCTPTGVQIMKPYSIPEAEFQYQTVITATGDSAIKVATTGLKNYLTSFQYQNTHATVATEIVIKDGATLIWKGYASANMTAPAVIQLPVPLRTTVGTALNVACVTTGANVYFNAQGYQAV